MSRHWLTCVVIGVALAAAGPAHGDVRVDYGPGVGGTLSATGTNGWRVIVEHFSDDSRNGFRVRQIGLGDPKISESSSDCQENAVFNDVVCNAVPTTIQITNADNAPNELAVGGSNVACAAIDAFTLQTTVVFNMGGGDDIVRPLFGCGGQESVAGNNRLAPVFAGDGGAGNDSLTGGRLNDVLRGNAGNDVLAGGSGDDELTGGDGNDTIRAKAGNDTLIGGAGADILDGDSGADTVKYEGLNSLTITLDGVANDGRSGEGDYVTGTETVLSGAGSDHLTGSSSGETLDGGAGNDEITGGNGADTLRGGDGSDLIDARDNASTDVVRCGDGFDDVIADLQDDVQIQALQATTPKGGGSACDRVERFAVDDGPPAQVVTRRVRIAADGSLSVRLRCPRRARVTCRGRIRLVDARRPGRTLASARYAAKRGHRSAPVGLRLSRKEARAVRARGVVTTVTRERGVSKKGPRSAINTLAVRHA